MNRKSLITRLASVILVGAILLALVPAWVTAAELDVTNITTDNEGWVFDPDESAPGTVPINFVANTTPPGVSLGNGYLATSIGAAAAPVDKFIMFPPINNLSTDSFNSFSFNYFYSGAVGFADDFYANVYVDLAFNSIGVFTNGFYDCRYDYVPTAGAANTWLNGSFNSAFTGWVLITGGGGCLTSLGALAAADQIRFIAVNAGQGSGGGTSDNGLVGGFDNIIIDLASGSNTYDFEPDLPEYLQFAIQPSNTQAGSTITPPVQVAYYDGTSGTIDTTFTGTVTLALGNNPGGGTLSGTLAVSAVAGVATFSNLSINNVGTGYTLVASAGRGLTVTSSPFDITAVPVVPVVPATPEPSPVPAQEVAAAPAPSFADSAFIVKSVDKTIAQVGDTLTFTINYGNPKGNTLNNVVIADTFDSRLSNIQVVSSSIGTPVVSGNSVTLQGISLLPGQRATLTITAQISSAAKPGDVIGNTASLESPDASIHFSNVTLTTILPGALPATGASPLSALRLPVLALLLMVGSAVFVSRKRRLIR